MMLKINKLSTLCAFEGSLWSDIHGTGARCPAMLFERAEYFIVVPRGLSEQSSTSL